MHADADQRLGTTPFESLSPNWVDHYLLLCECVTVAYQEQKFDWKPCRTLGY